MPFLNFLVEGTGDYLILLFLCELYEVNCVTAYSYCELGISFGMSLSVKESFTSENVNVKVVSALLNIAVKERNEVIYLVLCCCHMSGDSFQNLVLLKCDILAEPKNQRFFYFLFPP